MHLLSFQHAKTEPRLKQSQFKTLKSVTSKCDNSVTDSRYLKHIQTIEFFMFSSLVTLKIFKRSPAATCSMGCITRKCGCSIHAAQPPLSQLTSSTRTSMLRNCVAFDWDHYGHPICQGGDKKQRVYLISCRQKQTYTIEAQRTLLCSLPFVDTLENLRKATISFVIPVFLSVCPST